MGPHLYQTRSSGKLCNEKNNTTSTRTLQIEFCMTQKIHRTAICGTGTDQCTQGNEPAIVCRKKQCEAAMREQIRTILNSDRATNPDIAVISMHGNPGLAGLESAHVAVEATLAHLWLNQRNDVYRPHLVRAVGALQRDESILLMGWHSARTVAAWFCLVQRSLQNPERRTLIVVADDAAGLAAYRSLSQFVADIPAAICPHLTFVHGDAFDSEASIVIASYHSLQREILRQHDHVWKPFWQQLATIVLLDIHLLSGIAWQHARWMLRRIERVRSYHAAPKPIILMTATPAQQVADALATLVPGSVTVVPVDDIPTPPSLVVELQSADTPYGVSAALARVFQQAGYRVHVVVDDICAPLLWAQTLDGATQDGRLAPAEIVIYAGIPADGWAIPEAVQGGYLAVLSVRGQSAAEGLQRAFGQAELPLWVCGSDNSYVHTMHVLAAAAEIPILEREIVGWGLTALCTRMESQGYLRQLPGHIVVPAGEDDPHADFSLSNTIGSPATLQYAGESLATSADATLFERWLAPRMAVPAWMGGMLITERDIDAGSVTIAVDPARRLTLPIRKTSVECRVGAGDAETSGWARVAVDDALTGMREWVASEWHDAAYPEAFGCQWYAPACWWQVGPIPTHDIPWVGWTLIAAFQRVVPSAMQSVVPCYDESTGRLYIVETQPGGTGMLRTIAPILPELLRAAQTQSEVRPGGPVLAPFWRVDAEWMSSAVCPTAAQELAIQALPNDTFTAKTSDRTGVIPSVVLAVHTPPAPDEIPPPLDVHVAPRPLPVILPARAEDAVLMATLLDDPIGVPTERMHRAIPRPWYRAVWRWVLQQGERIRGRPQSFALLPGDRVSCMPYGDGIVIAVQDGPDGVVYRVATLLYGDVSIDPRQDLVFRDGDE